MKIELSNIKYADWASEETACYRASILINGVKVGEVSNSGQGGADRVHPYQLVTTIDAYAATLPPINIGGPVPGEKYTIEQDHETIFSDLLDAWINKGQP
jgi:hypothetical protein